LGPSPLLSHKLATLVLAFGFAYGFGYVGIILSPVHSCLVLSNRYFGTSLSESIIRMILPSLDNFAATKTPRHKKTNSKWKSAYVSNEMLSL
jgi:hypothetical protein